MGLEFESGQVVETADVIRDTFGDFAPAFYAGWPEASTALSMAQEVYAD